MAAHAEPFDLLLGRRVYDIWSGFWPKAPKSPMSDSLNGATKYVATHRPESLGSDIVVGVRRIKALILWGSSTLTPVPLEHEIADEILLLVFPVLLGKGKRFFSDGNAATRAQARQLEGRGIGCYHQHLQAERAFADRHHGRIGVATSESMGKRVGLK